MIKEHECKSMAGSNSAIVIKRLLMNIVFIVLGIYKSGSLLTLSLYTPSVCSEDGRGKGNSIKDSFGHVFVSSLNSGNLIEDVSFKEDLIP